MKLTLLNIVQEILNDLDSDEVNSIEDTTEAEQVASIVRSTYFDLIANRNWPHLKKLIQLDGLANTALPTHMTLPENVKEFISLRYNKARLAETRRRYEPVEYLLPDNFLFKVDKRNNDKDNIQLVVDPTGVELLIQNDTIPQWWTSFDDNTIILDAWRSDVSATIVGSKIQARAVVSPTWVHEDSFIPDFPIEAFPLLLAESKSTCFFDLKQMVHEKEEAKSQRQNRWLSRKAWRAKGDITYPNYGRRGRTGKSTYRQPLDKDD